ncbi:hypothetical protein E2C01_092424 [Portunus trituberculatus]|uniref:Uncharacterized protein n=1 Tax=Portunus trituberculatus TaxID=210409 RepID=A0A5B7JK20_PORTR|nr:hypothetical protein [Portunus trituberculatus]
MPPPFLGNVFILPQKTLFQQPFTPSSLAPGITVASNPHVSYKSYSQRYPPALNPLSFPPFLPPQAISP